MKFGGSSVADTDKIRNVARRLVATHETGRPTVGVVSAMGETTDTLAALAAEVSPRPHPREMDMLLSTGERISAALCAMAIEDMGHRAVSLTGSQAGIVTDTRPHQREDRGHPAEAHQGGAGGGHDRAGGRIPGRVHRLRRDHAGPRRIRPDRRGAGGGAGRRLRDLHRRRGRVHGRPADRAGCAQADPGVAAGDARDGRIRRPRAAATIGRVRPKPRRADPRSFDLLRHRGDLDPRGRRAWKTRSSPASPTPSTRRT